MEKTVKNIENGVVIDHIPPGKAMRCIRLMNPNTNNRFLIGMNFDSSKKQSKDFIKIEEYHPSNEVVDKISLIAPEATISTIKKGQVIEKRTVNTPKTISCEIKCINPKCVTNAEHYLLPNYKIESTEKLKLRCLYCDKTMNEKEIFMQKF